MQKFPVHADAQHYRQAARRLSTMRTITVDTARACEVDALIKDLCVTHRHRPRLQRELNRAYLP